MQHPTNLLGWRMLKVLKKIRLYGLEDEQGPHSLLAFLTIDPEDGLR
jgi:hypothetical protein